MSPSRKCGVEGGTGQRSRLQVSRKPAWKGPRHPWNLQSHGEEERSLVLIDGAAVLIHLLGKVKGFSLSVPTIDFALYLLK